MTLKGLSRTSVLKSCFFNTVSQKKDTQGLGAINSFDMEGLEEVGMTVMKKFHD